MSESLADLKAAFDDWRSKKRHARETIPATLLERARAAARRHGPAVVFRATKIARARLKTGERVPAKKRVRRRPARVPAFSRLDLAASAPATIAPFAEIEMITGLKVRLFSQTGEALALLTSLLGLDAGGAR